MATLLRLHIKEKSSNPTGLVYWYTDMAAVFLFRNTNMAAVTSCENALLKEVLLDLGCCIASLIFGIKHKMNNQTMYI